MLDIKCIDGKFAKDVLDFYAIHGVIVPTEIEYTIRDVIINSSGETGILLDQLVNPPVPFKHPIMGVATMEPNWNINRFRMLDDSEINVKELVNDLKAFNKPIVKNFNKLEKSPYELITNQ